VRRHAAPSTAADVCRAVLRSEGRIYEHSVDNIVLRDPPMGSWIDPLLAGWGLVAGRGSTPQMPCPGGFGGRLPLTLLFRV
jgi:hypothetical protein